MAHYGFKLDPISKLRGGSVRALGYILREKGYDRYNHRAYDYTDRTDFLLYDVILPETAPPRFSDPVTLCTEMDDAEKRYDGRTGRTLWLSLQNEFAPDEWLEAVREFAIEAFVSLGMCVVIGIHDDRHPDDPTKNNPNAHIILSDRPVSHDGFCTKKNRDWNQNRVRAWRKLWADVQNKIFERKGEKIRVSHLSNEVLGIKREPTVPLGRAAIEMEQRGIKTERGDRNREIEARNREQTLQLQKKQEHKRGRSHERGR